MKSWQKDIVHLMDDNLNGELLNTVRQMKHEGRKNVYIVDVLRRCAMFHLEGKYKTPKYAESIALAYMMDKEKELRNIEMHEGTRVMLTEPTTIGERRPAFSKHIYLRLPEQYEKSMLHAQKTAFAINKEMFELCKDQLDEWVLEDAVKILEATDGRFYLDLFLDFRGRINTNHRGSFSPQNSRVIRAMVDYAEPRTLGVKVHKDLKEPNFLEFLRIIDEEYGVTFDNYQTILKNKETEVRQGKSGPGKVRAAGALHELVTTGQTCYIVQQDATQSGYQHAAASMRDEVLGYLVNLIPDTERQDLYLKPIEYLKNTEIGEFFAQFPVKEVRTEIAKPTVMLTGYGSSADAIALDYLGYEGQLSYIDEDGEKVFAETFKQLEECLKAGMEVDFNPDPIIAKWLGNRTGLKAMARAFYLASTMQEALYAVAPSLKTLLNAVQSAAQSWFSQTKSTMRIVSPLGLEFSLMSYKVDKKTTVKISITANGKRKQMSILQMSEDTQGGASGALPNLMHMLDACLLHILNLKREEEGILDSADIHDSVGSGIDRVVWTSDAATEAFRVVHRLFNINKLLKSHNRAQIPMGNLELDKIQKVMY